MTQPEVFVTTSWDDGHVLDRKVADMLHRHGLAGTFYVAPRCVELRAKERLGPSGICSLAAHFEIGGHTLSHPRLPSVTVSRAAAEINHGKDELEQIVGVALHSFAYPGGAYDQRHIELVREAGFVVGRTVRRYVTDLPNDPLQTHTTVHGYRHWSDVRAIARHVKLRPADGAKQFWNWDQLANALFDNVLARGGVFHLWGHSWEIDRNGDWTRLERVMAHVGRRSGVTYTSNGALSHLATRPRALL